MSSLPLCAASAPQQRCARGTTTRQPLRARTRIVARLTSWNHRSCTHPERTATVPRTSVPAGGLREPRQPRERRRPAWRERAHPARQERPGDGLEERGGPKERGMRQHDVQSEPPEEPRAAGAERFHLDARALHHPAERHVRRADVLACTAHQAQVHEPGERVVDDGRALGDRPHGRDPSARRRRLLAGQPVRRTVGEAQATRDTRGQVGIGRRIGADPSGLRARLRPDEPESLGQLGTQGQGLVVAVGQHVAIVARWSRDHVSVGRLTPARRRHLRCLT